ncbi:gliding motility protein GldM [Flavobacterium sp.]|jgi:gliding motility-associated protein GldM|uniref:type IX secretion system motor protein PorM/GldM n=1 Tax=Flavobacterium sp. TaxID=239 RepID=UPI0037C18F87
MAGGKLTPRQKMVNLMYLVFVAMLAMNMSKEVLSAFGILNDKITESNGIAEARNQSAFDQLAQKAQDQPKQYGDKKAKVDKIRLICKDFYNYVEGLKTQFTKDVERKEDGSLNFEAMDKGDIIDEYWFSGDRPSAKGTEFLNKLSSFSAQIKATGGSSIVEAEMKKIEKRFATNKVKTEDGNVPWLDYNYKGFPLIASITKLSQIQADIKTTESDIISGMFQSDLVAAASLTAYQPIVVPDKTAFFQGETVTGKIILGKFDPNLVAKSVIVNGQSVKAEAGQAKFSFGAGSVGEKEITGSFNFDENGKVVSLPIKGNYVVVPKPNQAIVSADKMNVVYRGVDNPISVSVPGIPSSDVKASAPGMRASGKPGQYMLNPGQGKEVTINVSATLPNGGGTFSSKQTFRIKGIPAPTGKIRGEVTAKGAKSNLEVCTVSATLEDFDFPVTINVTQFNVKVPGQPTVVVQGSRMNGQAISAIKKAGRGDVVTISEIKVKYVGINQPAKNVSPCTFEVQ